MSLLHKRAEQIVDRADPADLRSELATAAALTTDETRRLDHVFRQWTTRALGRADDMDGLVDLHDLIGLALRLLSDESPPKLRWKAFRDLLDSKQLAMEGQQSGRARQLLHAPQILDLLEHRSYTQSELQTELNLSAQRLSQILNVMEEGGLVRRSRRGKNKVVALVDARPRTTGSIVFALGLTIEAIAASDVALAEERSEVVRS